MDDRVVRAMIGETHDRSGSELTPQKTKLPPGLDAAEPLLAFGAESARTFCAVENDHAILSPELSGGARVPVDSAESLARCVALFRNRPKRVVIDEDPSCLSSALGREWAEREHLDVDRVQHHHAHVAACLADNGWPLAAGPVLGVALDGLGYGQNGELWGGEFLLADYTGFERLATFKPVALLGGARAAQEPYRNTYAHLMAEIGFADLKMNFDSLELFRFLESRPLGTLDALSRSKATSPLASSCGRLFDAVAAALGVCRESAAYDGQAAAELEALVDSRALREEGDELAYPFSIPRLGGKGLPYVEPLAMWRALLGDLFLNTPRGTIAARFHKGLAKVVVQMIKKLARRDPERQHHVVALSGGVFQNRILLEQVVARLETEGFKALTHREIPPNDRSIALGQALVAAARRRRGD